MKSRKMAVLLLVPLILASCAAPGPQSANPAEPRASAAAKRITAAIKSEPKGIVKKANQSGIALAGADELELLVNAGLAMDDGAGGVAPQLGRAVPALENGLWRLFPDGRMETIWQIKPGARWHDRTPVTVEDLLFTSRVVLDREMVIFRELAYQSIDSVDAVDAETVSVKWKQPFIEADRLFSPRVTPLLPQHLLEQAFAEDKGSFEQLGYWTREYVGTGPFKLEEWSPGSGAVLTAYEGYVLGRPKIDRIEVKFITDPATLAANLLAGAVEVTLGRNLSLDQAIQIRGQWQNGTAEIGVKNWIMVYPQFIDPNPAVVGHVRFRQGLMHAIDRQAMVDTLMAGQTRVAHTLLNPDQPEYAEVERQARRYEHDARRAAQLIAELGFVKGPDGLLRDPAGQRLTVEIRTTQGDDLQEKSLFSVTDYWQRLGIAMEPVPVPTQRSQDREYRNTFPGFDLKRQPNDTDSFRRMHSSKTPLPGNNYVGENFSRYMNREFDALLEKYFVTIPRQERIEVVGAIAQHVAEHLNLMGLFYQAEPTMVSSRLVNVRVSQVGGSSYIGNAHEWDVRN